MIFLSTGDVKYNAVHTKALVALEKIVLYLKGQSAVLIVLHVDWEILIFKFSNKNLITRQFRYHVRKKSFNNENFQDVVDSL